MKRPEMTAVHLVEIVTPKGVRLQGAWVGAMRPRRVVIWMHGLGSSMFSKLAITRLLAKDLTAVLVFNNRGHDQIANLSTTKRKRFTGGAAHEVFTDCLDDIEGAIRLARSTGAKDIVLAGHSTGSQKIAYWAATKGRGVRGIVLLAPISDYDGAVALHGKKVVDRAVAYARSLVKKKRGSEYVPARVWPEGPYSASRFLSLYAGEGTEEIFTYWDPARKPATLRRIRIPTLVVLAGKDIYTKRKPQDIEAWFLNHLYTGEVVIVPEAEHGFKGSEKTVANALARFMKEL